MGIILSIVFLAFSLSVAAVHVAVLDLTTSSNISAEETRTISDRLESELALTKAVVLLERRRMQEILQEQGFQQSGACDAANCQVQVGQLLGVDQVVAGSVGKVGSVYSLNVKLIDVQSGTILQTQVVDIEGDLSTMLTTGCKQVAQGLVGKSPEPVKESKHTWLWISGAALTAAAVGGTIFFMQSDEPKTKTETIDRTRSIR